MAKGLFVGNLPYTTIEEELQHLFEQFGPVLSLKLIRDKKSGASKGFAFIEMEEAVALEAMDELNDTEFQGRALHVTEVWEPGKGPHPKKKLAQQAATQPAKPSQSAKNNNNQPAKNNAPRNNNGPQKGGTKPNSKYPQNNAKNSNNSNSGNRPNRPATNSNNNRSSSSSSNNRTDRNNSSRGPRTGGFNNNFSGANNAKKRPTVRRTDEPDRFLYEYEEEPKSKPSTEFTRYEYDYFDEE